MDCFLQTIRSMLRPRSAHGQAGGAQLLVIHRDEMLRLIPPCEVQPLVLTMIAIPRRRAVRGTRLLAAVLGLAMEASCGDQKVPEFLQCTVSPSSLNFGAVEVGSSANQTFMVTNGSSGSISGTISESCGDYNVVGSADYSLAKGESRTFTLQFSPSASGPRACTLSIGGCSQLSVSGQGTPAPTAACGVSPTSLPFGTVAVGASGDAGFTITNTGGTTLTGTVTESCPEFSLVGSGAYSLAPGDHADFTVRFSPTSGGAKSCTIDTGTLCANVAATGTGQAPQQPQCSVTPTALAFGDVNVGQSGTKTFTVTNTGQGTLSGSVSESCAEFSIEGGASYSLGAGQSATFTIHFTPLTGGDKSCTIETGAGCSNVAATGTGQVLTASCQLSATSLAFGAVTVAQTADRTLTITNAGPATLAGTVTEPCAEYSIVGDASYSLAALQSKTFTVRFAPTSSGDFPCTLDAGSSCGTVSLTGSGAPEAPPVCAVSDTSFDFGSVQIGKHKDHDFQIRNLGGGQLCGTATESCDAYSIVGATYCVIPGTPFALKVRFTPTTTGSFQCTIDPGDGCKAITVTGVGTR
jgi:HYDIN/CFA65/VesB-like, Ig-like domain/Cep192 domain 4